MAALLPRAALPASAAHARLHAQQARSAAPCALKASVRPAAALLALRNAPHARRCCARAAASTRAHAAQPHPQLSTEDAPRAAAAAPKPVLLRAAACVAIAAAFVACTPGAASAAALATPDAGLLPYLISFVMHLDKHLSSIVTQYGTRTYALLFAIVFAETVRALHCGHARSLSRSPCAAADPMRRRTLTRARRAAQRRGWW
jgi:hypothetical protein